MIAIKILLSLAAILIILLSIAVVRALMLKPTAALTATPPKADPERAAAYGKSLSAMVQRETVSSRFDPDRSKFLAFQDSLKPMFPHVFASCEQAGPGSGLVLRLPANGTPKGDPILLMSHHDVVPASPEGWEHEPFSGDIDEEGRVWGRGTVDTKGSLFCELQALEELLASGWKNDCDVYITSSCTEEWSGESAPAIVQYLKDHNVHLGMLMDEGGMILEAPIAGVLGRYCVVGVLEKGYGDLKFIARGSGGHSSAPGKNTPLVRLGRFMAYVDKHSLFSTELTPTVKEMFGRMAPNMSFGMKLIFGNLWLFGPLLKKLMPSISPAGSAMMRTTCAFTTAKGADGLNILPSEAYVTANMRFIHHQPNEESIAIMKRYADKFNLETEVIYQDEPSKPVDYTCPTFKLLEKVAGEIYPGYDVVPYVMTGGTDAKYYGDVCDNALRFAPIEINVQQYGSVHSINENLDSTALVPAVDFYKEILRQYKG
jgi:carboxypeptidase PM20D1